MLRLWRIRYDYLVMRAVRTDAGSTLPVYSVKQAAVKTPLLPHQQRVVDKLQASNGLLVAHGMGSGKTLSSIAAVDRLGLPVDAVMPAPLVANYQKELEKHVDNRDSLPDIRLRSYEAAARGGGKIEPERFAIADEAHRMRNPGTSLHNLARQVAGAKSRMLLTGSPVFNQPENLAVLMNAARGDQSLPEDANKFRAEYVGEKEVKPSFLQRLRGVEPGTVPYLKNRKKLVDLATGYVDVHQSGGEHFPSREDEDVDVPMSDKQYEVYKFLEDKLPWHLRLKVRANLPLTKSESANLNAFSTGLRQVSNTPRPFVDGMDDEQEGAASSKVQQAVQRLVEARKSDPNFRGVVYSNFLDAGLNPYLRGLSQAGVPGAVFHGGLTSAQKQQLVQKYNAGDLPALLLSSAGSEGLDLKGTKLIQLLEPHFNQSKIDQVTARGIRYKSHEHLPEDERKVKVQRFYSTRPKTFVQRLLGQEPETAMDRYLQSRSNEKRQFEDQLMAALQEASDRGPLQARQEGQKTAMAKYAGNLPPHVVAGLLGALAGGTAGAGAESLRDDASVGSTVAHGLGGAAVGGLVGGLAGRYGKDVGFRRGAQAGYTDGAVAASRMAAVPEDILESILYRQHGEGAADVLRSYAGRTGKAVTY